VKTVKITHNYRRPVAVTP